MPNTAGIGAGGLTNNYQRQEDRQVDRQNYDLKMNWNRTATHQLWVKFSHMNAIVDDLTNYLGPDPNATRRRRQHQGLPVDDRPYVDTQPDAVDGHAPSASRGRSRKCSVRTSTPATSASTSSGFRAPTIRASAISATPAIRSSTPASARSATAMAGIRSTATSGPIRIATNITKVKGRHDLRGGYFLNFLYLDHWQPETGNPRGRFDFNGGTTALRGGPDEQLLQPVRLVPARPGRHRQQERSERADDRARVAARACTVRDRWTPTSKPHAGSRTAMGVLPDHAPG